MLVLFATASLTDNRTSVQSHTDNIYVTKACGNLGLKPTQVNHTTEMNSEADGCIFVVRRLATMTELSPVYQCAALGG